MPGTYLDRDQYRRFKNALDGTRRVTKTERTWIPSTTSAA